MKILTFIFALLPVNNNGSTTPGSQGSLKEANKKNSGCLSSIFSCNRADTISESSEASTQFPMNHPLPTTNATPPNTNNNRYDDAGTIKQKPSSIDGGTQKRPQHPIINIAQTNENRRRPECVNARMNGPVTPQLSRMNGPVTPQPSRMNGPVTPQTSRMNGPVVPQGLRTNGQGISQVPRTNVPAFTQVPRTNIPVGQQVPRTNIPVVQQAPRRNVQVVQQAPRTNVPVDSQASTSTQRKDRQSLPASPTDAPWINQMRGKYETSQNTSHKNKKRMTDDSHASRVESTSKDSTNRLDVGKKTLHFNDNLGESSYTGRAQTEPPKRSHRRHRKSKTRNTETPSTSAQTVNSFPFKPKNPSINSVTNERYENQTPSTNVPIFDNFSFKPKNPSTNRSEKSARTIEVRPDSPERSHKSTSKYKNKGNDSRYYAESSNRNQTSSTERQSEWTELTKRSTSPREKARSLSPQRCNERYQTDSGYSSDQAENRRKRIAEDLINSSKTPRMKTPITPIFQEPATSIADYSTKSHYQRSGTSKPSSLPTAKCASEPSSIHDRLTKFKGSAGIFAPGGLFYFGNKPECSVDSTRISGELIHKKEIVERHKEVENIIKSGQDLSSSKLSKPRAAQILHLFTFDSPRYEALSTPRINNAHFKLFFENGSYLRKYDRRSFFALLFINQSNLYSWYEDNKHEYDENEWKNHFASTMFKFLIAKNSHGRIVAFIYFTYECRDFDGPTLMISSLQVDKVIRPVKILEHMVLLLIRICRDLRIKNLMLRLHYKLEEIAKGLMELPFKHNAYVNQITSLFVYTIGVPKSSRSMNDLEMIIMRND